MHVLRLLIFYSKNKSRSPTSISFYQSCIHCLCVATVAEGPDQIKARCEDVPSFILIATWTAITCLRQRSTKVVDNRRNDLLIEVN